ncbi:hypothetical protein [Deinococcus enclensis]|jgi:hypothetical protein|uniref:Uncharacterized protein n=1 Tax=Deinococcus enclensis TaxID=1049582 RepID=A0ABT9MGN6_9DEIO|nr:hypothetical protein [Deinococcus enclensis]MDP9765374.1 hypothetical protein [Deinococcus enclensis]
MKRDEYQIVTKQDVEVPGCVSLAGFTVVLIGLGLWALFRVVETQLGFGYTTPAQEAAELQASSFMWLCGAVLIGGWVAYLKGARELFRPKVLLAVLALLGAGYVSEGMLARARMDAEQARAAKSAPAPDELK